MSNEPKARSVGADGQPDGWLPPRCWRRQVQGDGQTRLLVSVPQEELEATHLRLVRALGDKIGLLYVRLTDRATGQLPRPEHRLALELPTERVIAALQARRALVWEDGRHQIWARGKYGDQVVLDELGLIYAYPDDPSFREALGELPEGFDNAMDTRDYVKVSFLAEADAMERSLWEDLGLVPWKG